MATPTQTSRRGNGDPTKDPSRGTVATMTVTVEITLSGSKANVSSDIATLAGTSFASASAVMTFH